MARIPLPFAGAGAERNTCVFSLDQQKSVRDIAQIDLRTTTRQAEVSFVKWLFAFCRKKVLVCAFLKSTNAIRPAIFV